MSELIKILIAGAIVLCIGYPLVVVISKWKEEMEAEEKDESEEE